jgi:hypothetical protein
MTEVAPINLRLLTGQAAEAQISLGHRAWPVTSDEMAKVVGAAAITALAHHRVQPAGGQGRELLERLLDEWQKRIKLREARCSETRQTRLSEDTFDDVMVHADLAGDGADAPFFYMVVAQNLCLAVA